MEGLTIYFKTNDIAYSEAFAGRGEFAVVKLVSEIMNKPDYSLIVLDEPEVSLHPGAQEKLIEFLLKQTLKKKLQIVISTHSPKFVQYLPEHSIKLFFNTNGPRFAIKNRCHFLEAFQYIGETIPSSDINTIFVEDYLVSKLIEKVIISLGSEYAILFKVIYFPGGADQYYNKAASYSQEMEHNKFIVLDGDKWKPKFDPKEIKVGESESVEFYEAKIKDLTGLNIKALKFSIDSEGEEGGNREQKLKAYNSYLKYLNSNLEYLPPDKIPEDLIWNSDFASSLLNVKGAQIPKSDASDSKLNFKNFTVSFFGEVTESHYKSSLDLFIDEFIKTKNEDYDHIFKIIAKFKK